MTDSNGAPDQRHIGLNDKISDGKPEFMDDVSEAASPDLQRLVVTPTGDYLADLETGAHLARHFSKLGSNQNLSVVMGWTLADIVRACSQVDPEGKRVDNLGIVIGFAWEIARMLTAIHQCPVLHAEGAGRCPHDTGVSA